MSRGWPDFTYSRSTPAGQRAKATCVAEKVLTYALGRAPTEADHETLAAIADGAGAGGFTELLTAVARSTPFLFRRPEEPE